MEKQKQAKQQIQIDSNILNTLSKAVRVSKKKGNLDRDEYKKGINASKTEALFLLFEDALEEFKANSFIDENFSTASTLLKGVDYTIKNIEDLCPRLSLSYTKETNSIGIFISAAINKIIKKTDTVNIYLLGIEVDYLGSYLPCGNLIIHGNVGKMTGTCMENGIIIIEGNAGTNTGHQMKNGIIIIEGNAGINTGCFMSEGTIIVGGNVGDFTGELSYGGKIDVYGKITTVWGIGQDARAAIFCKGKRVNNQ